MQINLDLDGDGGISGNTRGSHSPNRGLGGLQVRNRRSVMTPDSTIGSLSFTPRTFLMGDSPLGGRGNGSDRSPASNGIASSDGYRADFGLENDLWLHTYNFFESMNEKGSNQKRGAARRRRVSSASSASQDAPSSDGYRADFDLEADPWLLTYSFLDSINDQDSEPQRKKVHKDSKTIGDGRPLRRMHNNEDMRSQWAQNNNDAGMLSIPRPSPNNELQDPGHNIIAPPAQNSCHADPPLPSMHPFSNPLPSKYFPDPKIHLSHQGSGSRYPPHSLRIGVPVVKEPLIDPEPPTPPPAMQEFETVPVSDGVGERGVVVNSANSREDQPEMSSRMNLKEQRPKTAPNGGSVKYLASGRRYSAYAQQAAIQFTIEPPPPLSASVNRFPTVLRSGPASPHFNAHLDFSFNRLTSSLLSPLSNPPVHPNPTSQVPVAQSSPPLPLPATAAYSRSPPPDLATFTFPFENSDSPSLEERIDEEYEAALGRWSKEDERRVRRSKEVRECMKRLREVTEFGGNNGGLGWGF